MSQLARTLRLSAAALLGVVVAACSSASSSPPPDLAAQVRGLGDPGKGKDLILAVGCGACHVVPGIVDANGLVGPPLDHMARRQYIAGVLRNTPDNMVHWIQHPQQVVPGNAMPEMGLSEEESRQIAAYLYTLQ
jgi:cytochrome c